MLNVGSSAAVVVGIVRSLRHIINTGSFFNARYIRFRLVKPNADGNIQEENV